jgi:hypothetical protein
LSPKAVATFRSLEGEGVIGEARRNGWQRNSRRLYPQLDRLVNEKVEKENA